MTKYPRPPRRLDRLFTTEPLFFLTCCTYRRRPHLANEAVHTAFVDFAKRAHEEFNVAVGCYVILPDHIHLFIIGPQNFSLGKWVGALKRGVGSVVDRGQSRDPIWQRGFFDHVLRSNESYAQKWDYVRENPVRVGLVSNADQWRFAGENCTDPPLSVDARLCVDASLCEARRRCCLVEASR